MQKDLSFIIPMYNVESRLKDCLESIISQNIRKEIILIDDGSNDNTAIIAQAYLTLYPDIILIKKHHGGISAARNAGLRLATGRYVYFVDADDVILENNLDTMLSLADQHQIDWLKGMMVYRFDNGAEQVRPCESPVLTQPDRFALSMGVSHLNQMLSKDWLPSLAFGFFRRDFLLQNQFMLPENLNLGVESLVMTKLLTNQPNMRILEVSRPFYAFNRYENSLSLQRNNLSGLKSLFDTNYQLNQHYNEFIKKFDINQEPAKQTAYDILRVMAINYGIAYRYHYLRLDDEYKLKTRDMFSSEIATFMKGWLGYDVVL